MSIGSLVMSLKIFRWKKMGMKIGRDVSIEKGTSIDPSFPWLISIGNNVTIAPNVSILAHDASMKYCCQKTRLGKVSIGDNVFIGTKSIILPGLTIGSNVVIGAGSVVTHDIPDNSVCYGSPARIVCSFDEFKSKITSRFNDYALIDRKKLISDDTSYKDEIIALLSSEKYGYIDFK